MTIFFAVLMYAGVFLLDFSCIQIMPRLALVGKTLASVSFVLLAIFIMCRKNYRQFTYKKLIFTGLCFGALGDILLNVNFISGYESVFFLAGLTAFFIGHVFYIIAFINRSPVKVLSFLPMVLTLTAYRYITREFSDAFDMGSFFIPIFIYGAVVSFMAGKSLGLFKYKEKSAKGVWLTVLGAIFFYVSDFILLFLCFIPAVSPKTPGYNQAWFVILTLGNSIIYYTGQLLMALSLNENLE